MLDPTVVHKVHLDYQITNTKAFVFAYDRLINTINDNPPTQLRSYEKSWSISLSLSQYIYIW